MTFPIKKRANTELFIDRAEDGQIKDEGGQS